MVNKIKSAIGGLALLASTAFGQGSVTNAPVFTGISIISSNNYSQVKLDVKLDAGDNRSYKVQSTTNIADSASWTDSSSNTNLVNTSPTLRAQNVYLFEPYIESKMNYRIKEN